VSWQSLHRIGDAEESPNIIGQGAGRDVSSSSGGRDENLFRQKVQQKANRLTMLVW